MLCSSCQVSLAKSSPCSSHYGMLLALFGAADAACKVLLICCMLCTAVVSYMRTLAATLQKMSGPTEIPVSARIEDMPSYTCINRKFQQGIFLTNDVHSMAPQEAEALLTTNSSIYCRQQRQRGSHSIGESLTSDVSITQHQYGVDVSVRPHSNG